MRKKVVCLLGTGHCGSTLLDLLIGSHSQVFSLGEFHSIYRKVREMGKGGNPRLCVVCQDECEFWNKQASPFVLNLYYSRKTLLNAVVGKAARYIYNPYHFIFKWSGKPVIVDSSKHPGWFRSQFSPRYAAYGIDQYLIYICRDGRAVVNSYLRKYPERGVKRITETWMEQVHSMNAYYDHFPEDRKMKVHYEALASDPEGTMRTVCERLGLEYESRMLRYWEHEHHHIGGNAGTARMIVKYREQQSQQCNQEWLEKHKGYFDNQYYERQGLNIKLDERWKSEFSPENLEIFESLAGELNQPFIVEPIRTGGNDAVKETAG